jgi:hypothetical protein
MPKDAKQSYLIDFTDFYDSNPLNKREKQGNGLYVFSTIFRETEGIFRKTV